MTASMMNKTFAAGRAPGIPTSVRQVARSHEVRFRTIAEVAEALAVSSRSVRRAIDRKELVAHHFGRTVRIAESDLKAFIAQHRRV